MSRMIAHGTLARGDDFRASIEKNIKLNKAAVGLSFNSSVGAFERTISIPSELEKAFLKDKDSTLAELVQIATKGSQIDSVTAAAYAMTLLNCKFGGVVCLDTFDTKSYDRIQEGWNSTFRDHWIDRINIFIKENNQRKK